MTGRAFTFETAWGATLHPDGRARFRLWAPTLPHLVLRLGNGPDREMASAGEGWFETEVEGARPGTPYSFVLPDGAEMPDPAARAQVGDVHGPSVLVDPRAYRWQADEWRGSPWTEAVIYELHAGAFCPQGTFDGIRRKLDHLADTGVTAIQLMPVAQFAGARGWGYDGVLPYCPHAAYGGVDGLKRLVDAAHARELMVLLDVVYNHFGPDGNHIGRYAPRFFNDRLDTPWGPAIRFEEPAVRAFFRDNALYWLEEYRLDGLRFDAIDQIHDSSQPHILEEIADKVRARFSDRHIHLTSEDERNIVHLHPYEDGRPRLFTAEWNDDLHHAAHCLVTGEDSGYYAAFVDDPVGRLMRGLAEGFIYQGEPYSPWEGRPRGVPSAGQPPGALIAFLQNHDQIGNRAFGERLTALGEARLVGLLTAILILNPQIPLLFMGEEYGERRPFLFFTDFHGKLARAVRDGRRREFADFADFAGHTDEIPDPNRPETFETSCLDWDRAASSDGRRQREFVARLIAIRREHLMPRLASMRAMSGTARRAGEKAFAVTWTLGDGARLTLFANFGVDEAGLAPPQAASRPIFESETGTAAAVATGTLPPSSVTALLSVS